MTDKLQAIKKRCEELLAIAEKRTPGKWIDGGFRVWEGTHQYVCDANGNPGALANTAFIAACAGAAEAGWRATIAAIDALLLASEDTIIISSDGDGGFGSQDTEGPSNIAIAARLALKSIIAAWEGQI